VSGSQIHNHLGLHRLVSADTAMTLWIGGKVVNVDFLEPRVTYSTVKL